MSHERAPGTVEVVDLLRLAEQVVALARAAGAAIEAVRAEGPVGQALADKADGSPLSRADLASHAVIVAGLKALTPQWPVISEEDLPAPPPAPLQGCFWLVDPLDGTKEFLAGNAEYTVNIALIRDGDPVLGVVQVPAAGTLYLGVPGHGAWRESADDLRTVISVALPPEDGAPWRIVASRHHRDTATDDFIARFQPAECLAVGSSLKFCRIAEGAAHLYPRMGPTHEWDTAAAHAVLVAAGGVVVGCEGRPLRYGRPGEVNPAFLAACASNLYSDPVLPAPQAGGRRRIGRNGRLA